MSDKIIPITRMPATDCGRRRGTERRLGGSVRMPAASCCAVDMMMLGAKVSLIAFCHGVALATGRLGRSDD